MNILKIPMKDLFKDIDIEKRQKRMEWFEKGIIYTTTKPKDDYVYIYVNNRLCTLFNKNIKREEKLKIIQNVYEVVECFVA